MDHQLANISTPKALDEEVPMDDCNYNAVASSSFIDPTKHSQLLVGAVKKANEQAPEERCPALPKNMGPIHQSIHVTKKRKLELTNNPQFLSTPWCRNEEFKEAEWKPLIQGMSGLLPLQDILSNRY